MCRDRKVYRRTAHWPGWQRILGRKDKCCARTHAFFDFPITCFPLQPVFNNSAKSGRALKSWLFLCKVGPWAPLGEKKPEFLLVASLKERRMCLVILSVSRLNLASTEPPCLFQIPGLSFCQQSTNTRVSNQN